MVTVIQVLLQAQVFQQRVHRVVAVANNVALLMLTLVTQVSYIVAEQVIGDFQE